MTTPSQNLAHTKVSVIIPSYNMADYLPQTIDSIINQDYYPLEIIVADDGSTDHTQAVVGEYIERYPDQVKYVLRPNGGEAAARNSGIAASDAEFLMFVDGDDLLLPGAVSLLMGQMLQLDRSYCVVHGEMERFEDKTNRVLGYTNFESITKRRIGLFTNMSNLMMAAVTRRQALEKIGWFNEKTQYSVFTEAQMKLSQVGNFYSIPQPVYRYRLRAGSLSQTFSYDRAILLNQQSQNRLELVLKTENWWFQRQAWAAHFLKSGIDIHTYNRSLARKYFLQALITNPLELTALRLLQASLRNKSI
ncbi:MAG: glycosyltransferase [Pseudanabaena sp. ELA607]|jgi:glycosyltransferase involved in cell wall biosynthesis